MPIFNKKPKTNKITILQDPSTGLLNIHDSNCVSIFEGHRWEFIRTPRAFKEMFEKLNMPTNIVRKDYDDWFC